MTDPTNERPPAARPEQRDYGVVMADAIRVLTEAARLRREVLDQAEDGSWAPSVTKTEQADWAEFVTLAVAGAAANVGSIEKALAGRPGSWEAESVRTMLTSTVGDDQAELLRHRTEPLRIELWPEEILIDLGYSPAAYDESRRALEDQRQRHQWRYRLAEDTAAGGRGTWEALDDAPPFEEPNGDGRGETWDFPKTAGSEMRVPRTAADEAELARVDDLEGAVEDLEYERDPRAYGEALRAAAIAKAAELFPGRDIVVEIQLNVRRDLGGEGDDWYGPEDQIVEAIREETALPWSGIAPKDYAASPRSMVDIERDAGRLPHQRVDLGQYRDDLPDSID